MAKLTPKELRSKIAARKTERGAENKQKYAKMRLVAAKAPQKLEKCLARLADKYASMAEGIENMRENLGLVRAAKNAPIKVRVATTRNYAKQFVRIADESPDKLALALAEVYNGLNSIAEDIEMAATQMGVDLEAEVNGIDMIDEPESFEEKEMENEPSESVVIEEVEEEGETPEHEMEEMEGEIPEEPEEEKEAAGGDAWVTDRDESGEPKAPVLAAGNGQGGFTNDRDADSQPRTPAKLEIPQAQGKAAAMLKEAMTKKDFVLIADAIRGFVMPHDQRRRLAEHFASFLRGTNPNFLAGRFISYAMGEGGLAAAVNSKATPQSPASIFSTWERRLRCRHHANAMPVVLHLKNKFDLHLQ